MHNIRFREWEQQLHAFATSEKRQLWWHPALIKWCLNFKLRSSNTYRTLRESGVLFNPSERILRDYTHWIKSGSGFNVDVDKQLCEQAQLDRYPEYQKYVCLLFDEVNSREDLIYDKH